MKPFLKLSLLIFLTLCLFPLTSLAQTAISVGTGTLQPDGKNFIYNTCKAPTPGTIDLSWKLPSTSFTNKDKYICTIGCNRYDAQGTAHDCAIPQEVVDYCSKANKPCGTSWQSMPIGNTYVRKDGQIARYDYPDNSWNIQNPPTTAVADAKKSYDHTALNLLLQDKVTVPDVYPGNTYQVSCYGPKRGKPTEIITVSSPRVTVQSNCGVFGEPCEMPFGTIIDSFKKSTPVHITEKDLKSWVDTSQLNLDDRVGFPINTVPGSGDISDIESSIVATQCEATPKPVPEEKKVYFNSTIIEAGEDAYWQELMDYATFTAKNYPLYLQLRGIDWGVSVNNRDGIVPITHAVILVGVRPLGDYQHYDLDIIDPNVPKMVTTLDNCSYGLIEIRTGGGVKLPWEAKGLACTSDTYKNDGGPKVHVFYIDSGGRPLAYATFCNIASNREAYPNLCNRTPSEWLRNNLTNFVNPSANGGNCMAWSEFFLNAAYLGDFVGHDFHPGDGQVVNAGCTANHYYSPSLSKSTSISPKNFLANILTTITNLFR